MDFSKYGRMRQYVEAFLAALVGFAYLIVLISGLIALAWIGGYAR